MMNNFKYQFLRGLHAEAVDLADLGAFYFYKLVGILLELTLILVFFSEFLLLTSVIPENIDCSTPSFSSRSITELLSMEGSQTNKLCL